MIKETAEGVRGTAEALGATVRQGAAEAVLAAKARMHGSSILVDTNRMINKAEAVSSAIGDVERTFSELQRVVARTSGYWIGDAGDHHRNMFNEERDDIAWILTRLKEHPKDLKLMANNFETTERKLTEVNQKLRSDYI